MLFFLLNWYLTFYIKMGLFNGSVNRQLLSNLGDKKNIFIITRNHPHPHLPPPPPPPKVCGLMCAFCHCYG